VMVDYIMMMMVVVVHTAVKRLSMRELKIQDGRC